MLILQIRQWTSLAEASPTLYLMGGNLAVQHAPKNLLKRKSKVTELVQELKDRPKP
jgi:hypothetical protein